MRKDVKLAFVVGGILISVLIVYVLVVPGGQKRPDRQAVTLDETRTTGIAPAPASVDKPALATADKPGDGKPADAKTTDQKTAEDKVAETPTTKPTDPFASAPEKDNSELWMSALNRGTVPMMTSAPPPPTPAVSAAGMPKQSKSQKKAGAEPSSVMQAPVTPVTLDAPSTRPATPEPAPAGDTRTHVVKEGETISKISEAVYGSPNYWPYIVRANPGIVANKIRAGMTINIPPVSEVKGSGGSSDTASANDNSGPKPDTTSPKLDPQTQYEVQPGDSLQKIAAKLYGNTAKWQAIYDTNKELIGPDPAKVKAKSVLKLPEPPTVKS